MNILILEMVPSLSGVKIVYNLNPRGHALHDNRH